MNIVVLDGHTLNPGDLDWSAFEEMGSLTVYDVMAENEITERAKDCEIVITNKTPLRKETISKLDKMKYIGVLATGYDVVDVGYAAEKGIVVTNIPAYGTDTVAEMTFALIFELYRSIHMHHEAVKAGEWSKCGEFCFWKKPIFELKGKTIGIIGYGRIGRRVAQLAAAFGMEILVYSRSRSSCYADIDCIHTSLEEVFRKSDIISLHCPLTDETRGIVCEGNISKMKKNAVLINTARGPLVDEYALASALNDGRIAGAAVDVLSKEPALNDNPLMTAKNCIITPHIAWAAFEARCRLMNIAADNLRCFIDGKPINTVQ